MNRISQNVMGAWIGLGTRFLPFADAATPDLPLGRLLRLSLIQASAGMALVLLIGTLNRVMIVELGVPASLVGVMISLPLLFAPFRALIGFRSDTHVSAIGWKRTPFLYRGTMFQFGGLAIMPFALLVLSGGGNAGSAPHWVGQLAAALSFLLVGIGIHTTQTVGLALATDQATRESQPKVVGLMYVMLLFGTIASALLFGALLSNFSPGRLIQVIQGAAVATVALNGIAAWKQEALKRNPGRPAAAPAPSFQDSWRTYISGGRAVRRLAAVGLGTMAFSMEDVLLEPYGGQILHLAVADTTKLTATLAVGGLLGFGLASRVLSRGFDPFRMATYGALAGMPAFACVMASAPFSQPLLFGLGTLLIGFGAGLFGHGTLTATMNLAPKDQTGLALGAWGAVQASAAGSAIAVGGIARDLVAGLAGPETFGPAAGYDFVYAIEIVLLFITVVTMLPLLRSHETLRAEQAERADPSRQSRRNGSVMTETLVRIYPDHADALAIAAELKPLGYDPQILTGVGPDGAPLSHEAVVAAIARLYILKSEAELYAPAVEAGGALVLVRPAFGSALRATRILDSKATVHVALPDEKPPLMPWDDATPLSCTLQMPVLSAHDSTFTAPWNAIPLILPEDATFSWFGFPLLSDKANPLSSLIGMKLLSDDAAPLSSLLKLPTLI